MLIEGHLQRRMLWIANGPMAKTRVQKLKGDERINQDKGPRNMVACTV